MTHIFYTRSYREVIMKISEISKDDLLKELGSIPGMTELVLPATLIVIVTVE